MNPYAYVNDNPETKNDPTGHWGWGEVLTFTVIAVAVVAVAIVAAPVVAAVAAADITVVAAMAITSAAMELTAAAPAILDAMDEPINMAGIPPSSGCALSFRSDTHVATPKGEQAIGSLKVGQKVRAYNPQTRKMEPEPIEKIWLNHDTDLVDLTLVTTVKGAHGKATQQKEVLHTNEKHPFLTKEKGFIPVSQLKPGMHVLEANGQYGIVGQLVKVPDGRWMYNLTVAQDHTYAVGLDQWIVHNCTTPGFNTDSIEAKGFLGQKSLNAHWGKHRYESGIDGSKPSTYQAQAKAFMSGDPGTGVEQIYNPVTGQYYRYNPETGLFGITDAKGNLISFGNLNDWQGDNAQNYFYQQIYAQKADGEGWGTKYDTANMPAKVTSQDVDNYGQGLSSGDDELLRLWGGE